MDTERILNFNKEIPNTFKLWNDKTVILKRKVLIEKIEPENENSIFQEYFASFTELQRSLELGRNFILGLQNAKAELEKPRVLIEKNIKLIKLRKEKLEARKKFIDNNLTIKIKSKPEEITSDITSLEEVDFNSPITKEQREEIKKILDHYVYSDCIDEINCEIKEKDSDGIDVIRMNYGQHWKDEVAKNLEKFFTEHKTVRLPIDYEQQVNLKIDTSFNLVIKRRVLVEKIGYPTRMGMGSRYDKFLESVSHYNYKERKKLIDEYVQNNIYQEIYEVRADFHNGMNNALGHRLGF